MTTIKQFEALHHQSTPFILGNVWDAHTANLAEEAGFKGLGTSSHAIANSLGYEDGQNITTEEILFVVERVVKAVKIPVSVDFEAGYSDDPEEVAAFVKQLVEVGVVGINLEDGVVKGSKRVLENSKTLEHKIKAIKAITSIFINARTDTYTTQHPDALNETIKRGNLYKEVGADGFFVPLIEDESDIKKITDHVDLPLNIFATPNIPDFDRLGEVGVKRVSYGAKLFEKLMKSAEKSYKDLYNNKDFSAVL